MKKEEATNTFQEGMIMDLNPLVTPSNVVTSCLNGTITTFNGNENVLQNDMGNGRVETAFLPEGFIPLGTTEFGGIIYIVSYNPLTKKCQIGSFPSPERNFTGDEVSTFSKDSVVISNTDIYQQNGESLDWVIKSPIIKKKLGDILLNPGDKFIVAGNSIKENIDNISNYQNNELIHKYINFRLATVDSNGRLIYLKDLRKYKITTDPDSETIIKDGTINSSQNSNLDDYRSMVSSDYHIFNSKVSGNLFIVGELEVIDKIAELTWELTKIEGNKYTIKYFIKTESQYNNMVSYFIHQCNSQGSKIENYISNTNNPSDTIEFDIIYDKEDVGDQVDIKLTPCMKFGILEYLSELVHIDFSLIGSKQIVNNVWKYYKEENGMNIKFDLTNYYINNKTSQVKLTFKDLSSEDKSESEYWLPSMKSYNGLHIISIPFGDVINSDCLYKVTITSYLGDGTTDSITHYLYTNGVYNEYYLDPSRADNFDNEYLPLKLTINSEDISHQITLNSKNKLDEGNFLISPGTGKDPKFIKGKTIYTGKGDIPYSPQLCLEHSFNTFKIQNTSVVIKLNNWKSNPSVNSEIIDYPESAGENEVITNYTSLAEGEKLKIDQSKTNTISYEIELTSPIAASVKSRSVSVENYYAPLINTIDDVYKYGINVNEYNLATEITTDNIKFSQYVKPFLEIGTYPAVGMSGGGKDNKGGGGVFYVTGSSSAYIYGTYDGDTSEDGLEPNMFTISGIADASIADNAGTKGIYSFPNDDMDKAIQEIYKSNGIVPVAIMGVGGRQIYINNEEYSYTDIPKSTNGNRIELFNKTYQLEEGKAYICYWLFVRIKETESYIPIDWLIVIHNPGSDDYSKERVFNRGTYSLLALLTNLYAKRPFDGKIEVYTPNNISYVNKKVTSTCTFEISHNYSDSLLLFNNSPLIEMFKGENPPPCFSIAKDTYSSDGKNNTFKDEINFTFDISNKFLEEFIKYQTQEIVPFYVRGGKITPPDNPDPSKLYINSNNTLTEGNTLVLPCNKLTGDNYISNTLLGTIDNQDVIYWNKPASKTETEPKQDVTEYTFENLNTFEYDSRTDTLCISPTRRVIGNLWKWDNQGGVRVNKYIDKGSSISNTLNQNGPQ